MFVTLLAVVISAQPAPAEIQYRSYDVSAALARGCKVQRVSVAGRTEHAPIIRCPAEAKDARRSDS
ncbi:hypothetical protein Q9Q95_17880 [Sphingomonas sp. DG1-23]|jgi:hypothetical protein|uniref:hypothetical protein n=1 Tax=Sphingomonas sp. DG1-23 TaxID=3068316 RepID=UPI00273D84E4|nr:hypothetical protein [Sphingomonas sp. DG1-23]MDP5280800.1 hypothetical protein [Sphingomonas sp. DG1-23]